MDAEVTLRIVRSDGQELYIDENDWGLTDQIEGAEAAEYEIFTEDRGSGDGAIITGKRVAARDVTITAQVMDLSQNDVLRRQALSFFNPKYTFQLYVTYMGNTRWISGELTGFSLPARHIGLPQQLSANFTCADPYFLSTDDHSQDIASATPRWGFPFMDHPDYGLLVGVYDFSRSVDFDYAGDVAAPFTATLTAEGTVVNPQIFKDGYYVRIIDTMTAGDVIVIDFDAVTVEKNGENIMSKIDRTSDFTDIRMEPGSNTISFGADSGENDLHVTLSYYLRYLGV